MRAVDLTWAGGEHPFLLRIAELRALQDKCDAGPAHVLGRLASGHWRVDDVISTIRLGLEGGGMDKADARRLVERFCEAEPLTASVLTAHAVLAASLYGTEDDPVGEAQSGEAEAGEEEAGGLSRVESSGGASSTARPPSPVSPQRSIN